MPGYHPSWCLLASVACLALVTTTFAFFMVPPSSSSSPGHLTSPSTHYTSGHHNLWALSAKGKRSRGREDDKRKKKAATPTPTPPSSAVAPPSEPIPTSTPPQPIEDPPQPAVAEMTPAASSPPAPSPASPPEPKATPPVPQGEASSQEIDYAQAAMKRFGPDWEAQETKYKDDWLELQQALQGKINVYGRRPRMWDPITMLPVPPRVKLRQFWPQADDSMKAKYRLKYANDLEIMADEIMARFRPGADWEELRGFYLANRDWLGQRVKVVLSARKIRAVAENRMADAQEIHEVMKMYIKVDLAVMCHFKQAVRDAEVRLARNIGRFDVARYAGNTASEITSMWIILKGILAVWENRREEMKSTPGTDPNAISGTEKVVSMFQRMNLGFSEDESLIAALPPELQFLDRALGEASGTELRRWAIREFCPAQKWKMEQLRERIRLVMRALESLFIEDVGVLHKKLREVHQALALGTGEFEVEPFVEIFKRTVPEYNDKQPPFTIDPVIQANDPNTTVARDLNELIDYTIKTVGIPFPESEVERLTPLSPPANPFLDGLNAFDEIDTSVLGEGFRVPAEVMAEAGNVTQAQIDRILRNTVPSYVAGSPEEAEEKKGDENKVWTYLNMIQDMTEEERAEHYRKLQQQVDATEIELPMPPTDPEKAPEFALEDATRELDAKFQELFAEYKATLTPEEVERFETRMKRLKRGG